jgi:hypothetical protein
MNKLKQLGLIAGLVGPLLTSPALAVVVGFTGGTVVRNDASVQTTNNSVLWDNVDYYVEGGFKLDFLGSTAGFSTNIGNYYGVGNDVIHAHWATGNFGGVTEIRITKVGGGTFDLNYFILTSNTYAGGAPANGSERAWVEGFAGAVSTGAAVQLPSENWGFPATQVFLGSNFDAVDTVKFYVTNHVDCFGMDEFYIDQEAPPNPNATPDGASTLALLSAGFIGMGLIRRRKQ